MVRAGVSSLVIVEDVNVRELREEKETEVSPEYNKLTLAKVKLPEERKRKNWSLHVLQVGLRIESKLGWYCLMELETRTISTR